MYVNAANYMFIKLCLKLKHIYLTSYVNEEKLAAKVNAAS